MVLDSNMNFSRPMTEAAILYKEGQIKTFENFQAPYFARHDDILGLGNSKEIVLSNINNMTDFAKNNLPLWLYRAEPNSIFLNIAIIQTAFEISNMQKQNYPINQIRAAIQEAKYIKNDAIMEQFKSGVQKHFLDALSQYANPQPPQVQKFNEGDPVFNTVVCNDEAISNTDPVFWFSTGFKLAARLPIINAHVAMQPCLYWKRNETFSKPKMSSLQSAKLLMVQSEFDVPTPLSGAMETFNQLPATSMVYVTNEGSHGLQLYGTECVDLTVINYLLGQAPANRMTQCQGKPMALDAQTAQNQTVASSQSKASRTTRASSTSATTVSDETSNFEDPVLAQELLNRLRTAGSASLH